MSKVITGVSVVVAVMALAVAVFALTSNGSEEPAPTKADPAAYTVAYVDELVRRYEEEGLDATIAYANSQESVDGPWYGFVIDENGYTIGHPREELRGRDPSLRVDATGYFYGDDLLGVDEDGGWVTYVFLNPAAGQEEMKHTWAVKRDGILFGSGWYERYIGPSLTLSKSDPAAYTVAYVQKAIDLYERDGRDAMVAYYNSPGSVDGEWYLYVAENDVLVVHPTIPENVGMDIRDVYGPDGYPSGKAVHATASEAGGWTTYTYPNFDTGGVESKHSWVVFHDGLLIGSGWYEDGPAKSDRAAYTVAYVDKVLELYEALGLEETLAYFNSQESVDGPWYGIIIDENGYTIGHPREEIRGRDPSLRVDATGYFYGDDLLGVGEDGGWVDYVFLNVATGNQEMKHTWAVKRDGFVFASGWYERYIGPSLN